MIGRRGHHRDPEPGWGPLEGLTIEEVMLDLDPGWTGWASSPVADLVPSVDGPDAARRVVDDVVIAS